MQSRSYSHEVIDRNVANHYFRNQKQISSAHILFDLSILAFNLTARCLLHDEWMKEIEQKMHRPLCTIHYGISNYASSRATVFSFLFKILLYVNICSMLWARATSVYRLFFFYRLWHIDGCIRSACECLLPLQSREWITHGRRWCSVSLDGMCVMREPVRRCFGGYSHDT